MSQNIVVLLGTNREGNNSQKVAKYINDYLSKMDDVEVRLIDPSVLELPEVEGQKIPEYTEAVDWADAFVLVVPEYNHGYPGTLKKIMDTELPLYLNKAVGYVGVSAGAFGGARVVEALVPITRELGLINHGYDLYVPSVGSLFDENDKVLDDKLDERIEKFVTKLLWLSSTLKHGRNNL